jgi:hypothetical protein
MAPGTHLIISWLSTVEFLKERRERLLVTLSGVLPDIDGTGIFVDKITGMTNYYFQYHHYLGHSVFSALAIASFASVIAKHQRVIVWGLSFIVVHLHILCDVIGSKGPDGYHWPVYYFSPFNTDYELTWIYQWELNAWPNMLILMVALVWCGFYARVKRITFLEVFSKRLNQEAFIMCRKYFRKHAK